MPNDIECLRSFCANVKNTEVSLDYFLYHAMQYEACLGFENSKRYIHTPSWYSDPQVSISDAKFLNALTDWYAKNFPQLQHADKLTHHQFYSFLPPFISYMEEAKQLWQQHHGHLPAEFAPSAPFWAELTDCIKKSFSFSHLIIPYLHWRYGESPKTSTPPKYMPPNPFAFEKRIPRGKKFPPKKNSSPKHRRR